MTNQEIKDFVESCKRISTRWDVLVEKSLANRVKATEIKKKVEEDIKKRSNAKMYYSRLKRNIEILEQYLARKKEVGFRNINTALIAARTIIPHGLSLKLNFEPGDVYITDENGMSVNKLDGSGFRAVTSLFLRDRLLKVTDCIQTMVLDEPLTTLDLENSAEISKYLTAMAQEAPVILIEQKPEIFVSAENVTTFTFEIVDGRTYVRREIEQTSRPVEN